MTTVGGCGRHGEPVSGAAEQLDQLVAHDLDDLLPRRQRLEDVLADGLLADALDEALDDLEVDVGFEEGHAHLAEGLVDILLRQPAVAAEPVEDTREASGQAVEHGSGNKRGYVVREVKSQAYFDTSDAPLKARMACAGSAASKIAEPATRTWAPAEAN